MRRYDAANSANDDTHNIARIMNYHRMNYIEVSKLQNNERVVMYPIIDSDTRCARSSWQRPVHNFRTFSTAINVERVQLNGALIRKIIAEPIRFCVMPEGKN